MTALPSWMTALCFAVVDWPAAHGRWKGAKVSTAGSHAVARRVTFGTQTVGFLKLAILGPLKGGEAKIPSRIRHQGLSR